MRPAARRMGNTSATATLRYFRRKIMERPELDHVITAMDADPEGVLRYAEAVIAEERLPVEERERLRRERSKPFAQAHMATKLPTDKQLAYLQRLGYRGPEPEDRLAASQLIDRLFQQRGRA